MLSQLAVEVEPTSPNSIGYSLTDQNARFLVEKGSVFNVHSWVGFTNEVECNKQMVFMKGGRLFWCFPGQENNPDYENSIALDDISEVLLGKRTKILTHPKVVSK